MTTDFKSQSTHMEERYINSNTVVSRERKVSPKRTVTINQEYRPYLSILQSGAGPDYREPVCKNNDTLKDVNRLSITKNRKVTTSKLDAGVYDDINEEETYEEIDNARSPQQSAEIQDERNTYNSIYTAIVTSNKKSLGQLCLFIFLPVSLILLGGVSYFVYTELQSTIPSRDVTNVNSIRSVTIDPFSKNNDYLHPDCHLQYQNPERLASATWRPSSLFNSSNVHYSLRKVMTSNWLKYWVIRKQVVTNNCYLLVLAFQYVNVLSTSSIDCLVKDMIPITAGNISLLPTGVTLSTHQNTTRQILSDSSLADFVACTGFVYVLNYKKGQVLVFDEKTMLSVKNVTLRNYKKGHEKDKILIAKNTWYISSYKEHMVFMFDPVSGELLKYITSVRFPVLCDIDRYGNPMVIVDHNIMVYVPDETSWYKVHISVEQPIYAQITYNKKKRHMWVLYKNGRFLQDFIMV